MLVVNSQGKQTTLDSWNLEAYSLWRDSIR
jgi:hypothetical protein